MPRTQAFVTDLLDIPPSVEDIPTAWFVVYGQNQMASKAFRLSLASFSLIGHNPCILAVKIPDDPIRMPELKYIVRSQDYVISRNHYSPSENLICNVGDLDFSPLFHPSGLPFVLAGDALYTEESTPGEKQVCFGYWGKRAGEKRSHWLTRVEAINGDNQYRVINENIFGKVGIEASPNLRGKTITFVSVPITFERIAIPLFSYIKKMELMIAYDYRGKTYYQKIVGKPSGDKYIYRGLQGDARGLSHLVSQVKNEANDYRVFYLVNPRGEKI